jgi:hypothetical protein
MTHLVSMISLNLPLWLAQAPGTFNQQFFNLGDVWNLLKAIGIFILGLIVAWIAKAIVKGALKRTSIDNRIAAWISGGDGESIPIESWIANLVFWLIVLFAIVAFLNALQLEAVSAPLNSLLNQITSFLPQILGAALLLGIAWLVATVVKLVVTRVLRAVNIDERLGQQTEEPSEFSLSDTLGNVLYWFIFLLFLPAILSTLQLQGTLGPVQNLLNDILAILPNILAAILIGAVGWFIAQLVRRLTTNLLSATGINRVGEKFGFSGTAGRQSLSWLLGTVVYVLILIPVAIAALNALQIQAISAPAINMLNQVLNLIPRLFAAAVVLAIGYIIGRFIAEFVTDLLSGMGFNNLFQWLGISAPPPTPTPSQPTDTISGTTEQPTILQTEPVIGTKTPSQIVGIIAWIAIVLIAFLTAVDILQIAALTGVVSVILAIAGQVLIGLIIFAVGLYLANVAYKLIASSDSYQARFLAQAARVAIIIFASAMALDRMGVAPSIVNLAFGLLLGAIAVAIALAFGLGGREVANEQLRSWVNSFKNK